MADHEDYYPGEAPMAHKASHEDDGSDEISVAGLAGESVELGAHKILPSIHHARYTDAEATAAAAVLIATHAAISTAHQDAPGLIATHTAIATAHQDAPALILAHKGDADAHHAKFTITEHDVVARHPLANLDVNVCSKAVADTKIEAHSLTSNAHHSRYTDDEARATFPVGAIMSWPTEFPPYHWLECDGSSLLRSGDYSSLFGIIGVMYGSADGTHFNLPDYRGIFLRVWDHGAGVDPDAASRTDRGDGTTGDHVGTKQADMFKEHRHVIYKRNWLETGSTRFGMYGSDVGDGQIYGEYTGGNETRPVNINVMYIIKY